MGSRSLSSSVCKDLRLRREARKVESYGQPYSIRLGISIATALQL